MASVHLTSATPLTLSLSPWEKGPRMRGVAPDYNTLRRVIP